VGTGSSRGTVVRGKVTSTTQRHDHEEAGWVCDAAFQMATGGIETGPRRYAYTWVQLVTDQTKTA
ncbi:MAG: hypothetical protein WCP82_05085, partial [Alphaproteobacteria bacterium]